MKDIKAIVLAGGLGTRLRPITCTMPKPLCEILGESVIHRIIRQLSKCGISKAAISVMYMAQTLSEKLGDTVCGVRLIYVGEKEPRGSAGGAKYAAEELGIQDDDVFLVLSGDGVFDLDLCEVIRWHIERRADVTIVAHPSEQPLEYGVIQSHADGRIHSLTEKPGWASVRSDTVNTGIYVINGSVFKCIPSNREFDFSKDLFPHLIGSGKRLYSYEANGYWCDIGSLSAYFQCNIDAMSGKICDLDTKDIMSEAEMRSRGIRYTLPCAVSRTAILSEGCTVGAFSVIGRNTRIGNAKIDAAIIFDDCSISDDAEISNAIVCEGAVIGKGAVIMRGCTVGAGAVLRDGAVLTEGVCVWPNKIIEEGLCVTQDILFDSEHGSIYADEGYLAGSIHESVRSEYITKLGRALAQAAAKSVSRGGLSRTARIGIMHSGSSGSALVCEALLCGIKSVGAESYSFMTGFEAQARYAGSVFMTDYMIFVTEKDEKRIIKVFDSLSTEVTREFERSVEAFIRKQESSDGSELYDTKYIDGVSLLYFGSMVKSIEEEFCEKVKDNHCGPLCGLRCCFLEQGSRDYPQRVVLDAVRELGGNVTCDRDFDCIVISISDNGDAAYLEQTDPNGNVCHIDTYHIYTALIAYRLKNGCSVPFLPNTAPLVCKELMCADNYADESSRLESIYGTVTARRIISESRDLTDICFAVIKLLAIIRKEGITLHELTAKLPQFEIRMRCLSDDDKHSYNRASIMKRLYEKYGDGNYRERDGIRLFFDDGSVTVIPRRTKGFRLISESANAESASELCDAVFDEIQRLGLTD